ncbi:MAG TPA: DUF1206 domain-containing protein [Leifsonia sp.]
MSTSVKARRAAREARDSRALHILARVGFVASGLIQLILGSLALQLTLHAIVEPDQSGAVAEIGKLPGGVIVLWICVIGLLALGLWLLIQAALGIGSSSKKRWVRSVVSLCKALAYLALAFTALGVADGHPSHADASTQQASANILSLPAGQIALGVAGVITVGVGVYFIAKGLSRRFEKDIDLPDNRSRHAVRALGVAGYVAKGAAVALAGILFVVAAVKADPSDATGLSGAITSLESLPFGDTILTILGVGVIASGVYSIVRARLARFTT